MIYLFEMVMFHGYVKVPEGNGEYPKLVISPILSFTNNEQTHFSNLYELLVGGFNPPEKYESQMG